MSDPIFLEKVGENISKCRLLKFVPSMQSVKAYLTARAHSEDSKHHKSRIHDVSSESSIGINGQPKRPFDKRIEKTMIILHGTKSSKGA